MQLKDRGCCLDPSWTHLCHPASLIYMRHVLCVHLYLVACTVSSAGGHGVATGDDEESAGGHGAATGDDEETLDPGCLLVQETAAGGYLSDA